MIYDTLENAENYYGVSPRLAEALKILSDTDFSQLENGRHDIDGENIFMNISQYETKTENNHPEAHKKYIDIQYLISGTELVGVAPLAAMEEVYDPKKGSDCILYTGKTEPLTLGNGTFMILFPQDAHAPGIAVGQPETVRKAVVKVLI